LYTASRAEPTINRRRRGFRPGAEQPFRTITLDAWREIVEVAYEEALLGDDRARLWIQRTIGFADAQRERSAKERPSFED